eukprot:scaffold1533_cov157-Amphora_coffeaeformis.AAC.6
MKILHWGLCIASFALSLLSVIGSNAEGSIIGKETVLRRARNLRQVPFWGEAKIGSARGQTRRLGSISDLTDSEESRIKLTLALARTISIHDAKSLVDSYDDWAGFPLGTACRDEKYQIDLFISFSRKLDDQLYPWITEAIEKVKSLHVSSDGWGGCIRTVEAFGVDIPVDEDLYNPSLIEKGDINWVNGPNRHFEKTFRHVRAAGDYDAMFLMESDTHPIAAGWLDNLIFEIEENRPFALIGSKYNGRAWDEFADQLSIALLQHINGNAIYNVSHPLMENIVSELESEAETVYNVVDEHGKRVVLQPKYEKFSGWWEKYSDQEPVKESNVLTNYGPTAHLKADIEPGISIVHGKNMYFSWDSDLHGDIALVLADFGEIGHPYKDFLSMLSVAEHPFTEIVIMTNEDSVTLSSFISEWTQDISVTIQTRARTDDSGFMDLCEADVKAKYFVMTDVYKAPVAEVEPMFDDAGRPVVNFVHSDSGHCSYYASCAKTMAEAKKIYPSMDKFILPEEVLFQSKLVSEFCEQHVIRAVENEAVGEEAMIAISATSYIAHLLNAGVAETLYRLVDATKQGRRKLFVAADPKMTSYLKYHVADVTDGTTEDTPMLWHIPKAGGTSVKHLLGCLGLTQASGLGEKGALPDSLRVVKVSSGAKYVNVNVATLPGISNARDLNLIGSGLADAVVTPLIARASKVLFSTERGHRARIFTIFRHPVERAESMFAYLSKAYWEPTYDPSLANMTIEEYAISVKAESNWMVRMLNDDPPNVDKRHLEVAKLVVKEKIVVGLMSNMTESVERFYKLFGWEHGEWNPCEDQVLFGGGSNSNEHEKLSETSEGWKLLAARNSMDVELFEYAVKVFEEQKTALFSNLSNGTNNEAYSAAHKHGENGKGSLPKLSVETELEEMVDSTMQRNMQEYPSNPDVLLCDTVCCNLTDFFDFPDADIAEYVVDSFVLTLINVNELVDADILVNVTCEFIVTQNPEVLSCCGDAEVTDITMYSNTTRSRVQGLQTGSAGNIYDVVFNSTLIIDNEQRNCTDAGCGDEIFEETFTAPNASIQFVEELVIAGVGHGNSIVVGPRKVEV